MGLTVTFFGRSERAVLCWGIVVFCLAAAVVLIGTREPWYHGKTVSSWFHQLYQPEFGLSEAQYAIHEIGPRAVPCLLQKLREGEKMKDKNNPLLRGVRSTSLKLTALARRFFPKHQSQVSELVRLVFPEPARWDDSLPLRVRWALRLIGPESVPALVPALHDQNLTVRMVAIETLGLVDAYPDLTVPALTQLLSDTNATVRLAAVQSLGQIGQRHPRAIPALVIALKDGDLDRTSGTLVNIRASAAKALGTFGPDARQAVPMLKSLLGDANPCTRQEAAIALWRIGRDTNTLPVLMAELQSVQDDVTCTRLLKVLSEMGADAKEAAPMIADCVNNRFRGVPDVSEIGLAALQNMLELPMVRSVPAEGTNGPPAP